RSERFQQSISSLERLGFFQATENEGSVYMLWTSLLSEVGDATIAEQILLQALKALQAPTVSLYIRLSNDLRVSRGNRDWLSRWRLSPDNLANRAIIHLDYRIRLRLKVSNLANQSDL